MRRGAALIFVIALLAGCGGGDKGPSEPSEARRGYERAVRGVVAQAREARARPAALRVAAERLRGIRPPREVARPHRDLAAGFAAVADARERGTEVPDAVFDRVLAARRSFALRRYDIGVYGPLR
jgi:hypothetical protein